MPDICMCTNEGCLLSNRCYRSIAIPDPYSQSWAHFDYVDGCEYFIDVMSDFNKTAFDLGDESEPFRG